MPPSQSHVGIAWHLDQLSGWGNYGYQIIKHMCLGTEYRPVLLEDRDHGFSDSIEKALIDRRLDEPLKANPGRVERMISIRRKASIPVLHALGENARPAFSKRSAGILGSTNHALTFFENGNISEISRDIYNRFESVTAGSSWNADLLAGNRVRNVEMCIQGIDPSRFHPAPNRNLFPDRFVIYAGGKMEFRKGQDIVLRAISKFIETHDDALLICVWGNKWANSNGYRWFANSPHIENPPRPKSGTNVDLLRWFETFGLRQRHVMAFHHYPHADTPGLIREADVAVFANRCEGGTNLVAMETMACGIPTIISKNTGHLDIIFDGACLPLTDQRQVVIDEAGYDASHWGESSVDEIIAHLEFAYDQREKARSIGAAGARKMQKFTWDKQVGHLIQGLKKHGL